MRCDLASAPSGEGTDREAFRAHFPDLVEAVEKWNETVVRTAAAPQALWRRLANSARDHGITEPPFMVGALIDHLATRTLEGSTQVEPEGEPIVEHFRDRPAGGECVSVYLLGRRVASLPGGSDVEVERRVRAADGLIRSLLDDARTWEEARDAIEGRKALAALRRGLLAQLELRGEAIEFVAACPRCRLTAEGEAELPPSSAVIESR